MKKCFVCEKEIEDNIDVCPYCGCEMDDEELYPDNPIVALGAEIPKSITDKKFNIVEDPSTFISLHGDVRALKFFLFIFLVIIIFCSLFCIKIINEYDVINSFNFYSDECIRFVCYMLSIVVFSIGVAICGYLFRKQTYLINNGIVIKNIKYEIIHYGISLYRVKIVYKDEDEIEHTFIGSLPNNLLNDNDLCDVLVDRNNYKNYIIRHNIF